MRPNTVLCSNLLKLVLPYILHSTSKIVLLFIQTDPEWTAEKELCMRRGETYNPATKKSADEDFQSKAASQMQVGQRCEVNPGGKRGEIRYV